MTGSPTATLVTAVPDLLDPAGVLVAEGVGERRRRLLLLPLSLEDVQVGPAQPGAADLHDHVERALDVRLLGHVHESAARCSRAAGVPASTHHLVLARRGRCHDRSIVGYGTKNEQVAKICGWLGNRLLWTGTRPAIIASWRAPRRSTASVSTTCSRARGRWWCCCTAGRRPGTAGARSSRPWPTAHVLVPDLRGYGQQRQAALRLRQADHGHRRPGPGRPPRPPADRPAGRPRPRGPGRPPARPSTIPSEVERLAVLDIVPTREMFARADADRGPRLLALAVPPPARPPRAPGRPQHRGLPALVLRALDSQPAGRRGGRPGVRPRLLGPGGAAGRVRRLPGHLPRRPRRRRGQRRRRPAPGHAVLACGAPAPAHRRPARILGGHADDSAARPWRAAVTSSPRSGPTRSPGSCWPSSAVGPPVGGPGGPTASRCLSGVEGNTAELVEGFSHAGDSWAVLGEQLAAGGCQPTSRARDDADRTGQTKAPHALPGSARRQVVEAVVVEVPGRLREAEEATNSGPEGA